MITTRMVCGCLCIISSFVPNLYGIFIMRVIIVLFEHLSSCVYQTGYFLNILGPTYGSLNYVLINGFCAVGIMGSAAVSYVLPDWRHFNWFLGVWSILEGVYFFILPRTFQSEYAKGNQDICITLNYKQHL